MTELLSAREAAALLRVHVNSVKKWSDRGDFPFTRVGTRGDRRYRRADLEAFLERNTIEYRSPRVDRGPAKWGDLTE